jgi:hypothetical protein
MKKTTRRLAQRVNLALLDLPDALLLEMVDGWLRELDALFEDSSVMDESYGMLGYRARSEATGRSYASLDALDESEPEVEEFSWMPPAAQELREKLRTMQPTRVYHTVVALAGEIFRQKPFAVRWGEPPGGQDDGYVFIRALVGYLVLRKAGGDIALEQFEALYSEQLEVLAAVPSPAEEGSEAGQPGLFSNERRCHFRVVFLHPPGKPRRNLLQALQQYDCTIQQPLGENDIEGYVSYFPSSRDDLKTLARVRRLLNRWQRDGQITWRERKEKPPRRRHTQKQRRSAKRK